MHPALNYEISLFLSHFFVLLHSMHGHRIPHEARTEMHIDIKSCNTPNFYDTYHTFMTLCCIVLTTCFTRSVPLKIKAPVKVNPFLCFCFLIGQDLCALTSQYLAEQAPGCMNIRHIMTCALFRYSVYFRRQVNAMYTFQSRINVELLFQMWYDSVCVCVCVFCVCMGGVLLLWILQFFVFP